jgi:hypothetical protein
MKRSSIVIAAAGLMVTACASALGGRGDPVPRDAIALRVPATITAEALGARLRQGGYEFAMLSAPRDSAWLATAATAAGLQMTRPGRVGENTYVFFGPKAVGDTTHTVPVPSGGQVRLHDALFQVDKARNLDLIIARFEGVTDLRSGVRALLGYVGSDVSNSAALLLGVDAPTPQFGDSVALLLRALYTDTRECGSTSNPQAGNQTGLRLFYGPQVRVRCERAEVLNESGSPISVHFLLP